MATSRRKVRALTDLNAKQVLQKLDGADVVFEASGSLVTGRVLAAAPLTASAGLSVSGSSGLIVKQTGVVVNDGGVTINNNTGLVINSNGITVNSGGASITGLVTAQNGLSVTGDNLYVANNVAVSGNLEVSGNLTVRGTPTIISSDVLEVKDNIIVINKISGSDAAYSAGAGGLYVYRGTNASASLLWVSSSADWQFSKADAGSTSLADLSLNKLKVVTVSGSAGIGVSSQLNVAAPLLLKTTASFGNYTVATSSVTVEGSSTTVVDVEKALHAIDAAIQNVASSTNILNAYKRLRFHFSGTLDVNGEADITLPLTQASGDAFPTTSLGYITTDVMVWDTDRWVNDLVAVDLLVSASAVHVLISAAASPSTDFRLIAVNELTSSYTTA